MKKYSNEEYNKWAKEVKQLYEKIKLHNEPYNINFLNNCITIFPNVFSPKYFFNTRWYAEKLPKIIGNGSLLEIGTGTGAIAIEVGKTGSKVFTTDINNYAIECAKYNYSQNNINIEIIKSDVYDDLNPELKFDFIFWNHPYNNSRIETDDILIKAGFDYNYNSLSKYISGASKFLKKPNKGLLLGTGGHADLQSITEIAKEHGYILKLHDYVEMPLGENTTEKNDFRIYELFKSTHMNKDDLWKIHSNVSDWIKVADSKAVLIAAIVGIIVTLFGSISDFKIPALFSSELSLTFLISSIIFSLISISAAIMSLYSIIQQKIHKSNIFFADIQRFNNYSDYSFAINSGDLEEDLSIQIIINSKIATKKHRLLQWSVALIGLSILSVVISFILSMVKL